MSMMYVMQMKLIQMMQMKMKLIEVDVDVDDVCDVDEVGVRDVGDALMLWFKF